MTTIKNTPKHTLLTELPTKIFRGEGFMTVVAYNNKGDLLYVGDKNSKIIYMIDTKTNKLVGTFYGHNGTIWHLAISDDDNILVTCGADLTLYFYNAKNGNVIYKFDKTPGIPKQVSIFSNNVVVYYDSLGKRNKPYIIIYDLDTLTESGITVLKQIECDNINKPTVLKLLTKTKIIIGHETGQITVRDLFDDSFEIKNYNFHTASIKSLNFNNAKNMMVSGSLDTTAKLIKINIDQNYTLEESQVFQSGSPVNYAIFSYNEKKVILSGGADALNVAMSANNDLTIKFFGIKEKKLISKMTSHFGPVRYLARAPKSKNFVSAGQDGIVKIYLMPDENSNEINQEIQEESNSIEPFGLKADESYDLADEVNKIDYVNVKPPPKVNPDVNINYVPGMNIPRNKGTELFVPSDKFVDEIKDKQILESEVNKTTVMISCLPFDVEYKELREYFEFFGKIQEHAGVKIHSNRFDTFAFIKYETEEGAQKAILKCNNKPFMHSFIKVELAKSR